MKSDRERNPRLYWQWFAAYFFMLLLAAAIVEWVLPTFESKGKTETDFIESAVIFSPFLGMSIYGFCMNYFPYSWYNEIRRGWQARIWNLMFLVIYIVLLAWETNH
jgi:hypothetical protein